MSVSTITLRAGDALPPELRRDWVGLRESSPQNSSPYFHPAYTEAVATVSPEPVSVIVDESGALMTVQGGAAARPMGAPMSDYHGVVGAYPGGAAGLLRAAGKATFTAGGLIEPGADTPLLQVPVCRIDLSGGVGEWTASRDKSYRRHAKSHRRRVRKATEDMGEPRVDWRSRNVDDFNTLVALKRAQYAASGKYDVLGSWPGQLIRNLWERGGDGVWAELHILRFGNRFAAADLGLTDGTTFHSWIVAYDPELASYGPGIQLLEALVQASPGLGYTTIDLGMGLDGYKRHYTNVDANVGVGVLRLGGARADLSRLYGRMESRLEPLARLRRRYAQVAACEPRFSGRAKAMGEAVLSSGRSG